MTKQEVLKCLTLIETIYSYCLVKSETVAKWFEFCADLDYENVIMNLRGHIRKSPYPPSLTELSVIPAEKYVQGTAAAKPVWMNEYIPKKHFLS